MNWKSRGFFQSLLDFIISTEHLKTSSMKITLKHFPFCKQPELFQARSYYFSELFLKGQLCGGSSSWELNCRNRLKVKCGQLWKVYHGWEEGLAESKVQGIKVGRLDGWKWRSKAPSYPEEQRSGKRLLNLTPWESTGSKGNKMLLLANSTGLQMKG